VTLLVEDVRRRHMNKTLSPAPASSPRTCPCDICRKWRQLHLEAAPAAVEGSGGRAVARPRPAMPASVAAPVTAAPVTAAPVAVAAMAQ
jgi:hypothetical protein